MGAYIDPKPPMEKEEWLEKNGKKVSFKEAKEIVRSTYQTIKKDLIVVWVDNGLFTAAGIAFDEEEFDRFSFVDERPKQYWVAPLEKLHEVSKSLKDYLK